MRDVGLAEVQETQIGFRRATLAEVMVKASTKGTSMNVEALDYLLAVLDGAP